MQPVPKEIGRDAPAIRRSPLASIQEYDLFALRICMHAGMFLLFDDFLLGFFSFGC